MKVLLWVIGIFAVLFHKIGDGVRLILTGELFYWIEGWLNETKRKLIVHGLQNTAEKRELREAITQATETGKAVKISFKNFRPARRKVAPPSRIIGFVPSPSDFPAEMSRNPEKNFQVTPITPEVPVLTGEAAKDAYEKELGPWN